MKIIWRLYQFVVFHPFDMCYAACPCTAAFRSEHIYSQWNGRPLPSHAVSAFSIFSQLLISPHAISYTRALHSHIKQWQQLRRETHFPSKVTSTKAPQTSVPLLCHLSFQVFFLSFHHVVVPTQSTVDQCSRRHWNDDLRPHKRRSSLY